MKDPKNLLTNNPQYEKFSALIKNSAEGIRQYSLLKTSYEMGLFDRAVTPKTSAELAKILGYQEAMFELFCEALAEMGLLVKEGKAYKNSPITNSFLCHSSPYCKANTLKINKEIMEQWNQLDLILKNGPIVQTWREFFADKRLFSIAEWAEGSAVSDTMKAVTARLDVKRWRCLIDLGGGHGLFAIAFTALNPQLEAYVYDLPDIVPAAEKYIKEYGAKNVHTMAGDFYKDDIGQDYDAVFSSITPICFDPTLISKLVQALKPDGDLILRRFKDSTRESAVDTLEWNFLTWQGKKIGSKPRTSGDVLNSDAYVKQLKSAGLTVFDAVSVDKDTEIVFAKKQPKA